MKQVPYGFPCTKRLPIGNGKVACLKACVRSSIKLKIRTEAAKRIMLV